MKTAKQQKTWQQRQIVHHILNWVQTQLFAKTPARNQIPNYFTYRADINQHPNIRGKITDELSLTKWTNSNTGNTLLSLSLSLSVFFLSGIIVQFYETNRNLTGRVWSHLWSLINAVFCSHTAHTVSVCLHTVSFFSCVSRSKRHSGTGFSTAHF